MFFMEKLEQQKFKNETLVVNLLNFHTNKSKADSLWKIRKFDKH